MKMTTLKYAILTDPGNREVNEDSVGAIQYGNKSCFILCDGLGGHGMGDVASKLVRDNFIFQFRQMTNIQDFLSSAFLNSQEALMIEQNNRHVSKKMKTTAVALVTDEKNAYIGHVGDSRLYIFNKNKIKRRTLDHSIPQMLVSAGDIKESQIRNHPDRNIVLRVLGVDWEKPMYDLLPPVPLKRCQAFLLCSDGFWELIDEDTMCLLLQQSNDVNEWLLLMADEIKKNGVGRDTDNYSAIAVWNLTKGGI